jgi:hypothetical protein
MKTLADFQSIVARVAYKPGFRIEVYDNGAGSLFLQVKFTSADPHATTVGEQVQHGRKWLLSSHMPDGEVVQTCLAAILAAEEHEAREFFTYQGRAIFGPHFNLEKLVALCDEANATEVRAPIAHAK